MDNVTPIQTSAKPKSLRSQRAQIEAKQRERDEGSGFTTMDLIGGLCGICVAAETAVQGEDDITTAQQLFMAAKVLSAALERRLDDKLL